MSRRDQIRMSDAELAAFLAEQRTVICATNGRDGWPHLMPLWYVVRDGQLWAWTYARSQKVRNLQRDSRASLQVEAGETYEALRGALLECETTIHRETAVVADLGADLLRRYGDGTTPPEALEAVQAQAIKRVALQFSPRRVASWDHRKLAGAY